jgi:spore coat protein U-like protein
MSISRSFWKKMASVSILGLGAALFQGESAQAAGSASATLDVSATVVAACQISTGAVNFGNYDPLVVADKQASGTVTVTCANGLAWEVLLDEGSNPDTAGGSTPAAPIRQMIGTDPTNTGVLLSYSLWKDSNHTQTWQGATGGGVSGSGNGGAQVTTVYGLMTHGQNKALGAYSDQVTATVNY